MEDYLYLFEICINSSLVIVSYILSPNDLDLLRKSINMHETSSQPSTNISFPKIKHKLY